MFYEINPEVLGLKPNKYRTFKYFEKDPMEVAIKTAKKADIAAIKPEEEVRAIVTDVKTVTKTPNAERPGIISVYVTKEVEEEEKDFDEYFIKSQRRRKKTYRKPERHDSRIRKQQKKNKQCESLSAFLDACHCCTPAEYRKNKRDERLKSALEDAEDITMEQAKNIASGLAEGEQAIERILNEVTEREINIRSELDQVLEKLREIEEERGKYKAMLEDLRMI